MVGARFTTFSIAEVSLTMGGEGCARLEVNGVDMSFLAKLPAPALEALAAVGREGPGDPARLGIAGLALVAHLKWLSAMRTDDALVVETCTQAVRFVERSLRIAGARSQKHKTDACQTQKG